MSEAMENDGAAPSHDFARNGVAEDQEINMLSSLRLSLKGLENTLVSSKSDLTITGSNFERLAQMNAGWSRFIEGRHAR